MSRAATRKPATPAEYLAALDVDKRRGLERLRTTIRKILPRAEEVINYGLIGFREDGQLIVWIGAAKHHCAFYPGASVQQLEAELTGYEVSKGTVRFAPDETIPATIVRKLIAARKGAIAAKTRKPATRKKPTAKKKPATKKRPAAKK